MKADSCPISSGPKNFSYCCYCRCCRWRQQPPPPPSFSSDAASTIHDNPCKRCPARYEHSADSQSSACNFDNESNWNNMPGRPSRWPNPRSCYHKSCSCRCNCCILEIHHPVAKDVRLSRAACHTCCSENNRYAIGCRLEEEKDVSDNEEEAGGQRLTQFKCFSLFQNLMDKRTLWLAKGSCSKNSYAR